MNLKLVKLGMSQQRVRGRFEGFGVDSISYCAVEGQFGGQKK